MAVNYKICRDDVLTTTSIDIDERTPRETTTQWDGCDIETHYITLRFSTTVPSDDAFRVFYTYESIECYEYGCQFDATPIINNAFVTMPAEALYVDVEIMTYRFECCAGEGGDNDVFKPLNEFNDAV